MLAKTERVRTYDEVVGQTNIIKTLKKYSLKGFPDVIQFIGHSGAGKGTLAFITAMSINCHNPIVTDDCKSPCLECPSCQDIMNERFQRNTYFYNGGMLKADGIEDIEKKLLMPPVMDKNMIFILDEAHMITSIKKFLPMIEEPRSNVYFILCSTDKTKFTNISKKDNKSQEQNALRSRGAYFDVKPITKTDIISYLARLLDKYDPNEKLCDDGLMTIVDNVNGNLRQAINDLDQCLTGELYTKEQIIDMLGYVDEKEYWMIVDIMLAKDVKIFEFIEDSNDVRGMFEYSWKVLNNICVASLTGNVKTQWQLEKVQRFSKSPNFDPLLKVYESTREKCQTYFDPKVWVNELYRYLMKNKITLEMAEQLQGKPVDTQPARKRRRS